MAQLARTRDLGAGTVIVSGPVSNADERRGVACLAERRALETLARGTPASGWLHVGDRVEIEVTGRDGESVFGAITQRVAGPGPAGTPDDHTAPANPHPPGAA